jgi:hypothetical protein
MERGVEDTGRKRKERKTEPKDEENTSGRGQADTWVVAARSPASPHTPNPTPTTPHSDPSGLVPHVQELLILKNAKGVSVDTCAQNTFGKKKKKWLAAAGPLATHLFWSVPCSYFCFVLCVNQAGVHDEDLLGEFVSDSV